MKGNSLPRPYLYAVSLMVAASLLYMPLFLLPGCGGAVGGDALEVAVDIAPLAYLCKEVGGERVVVEALVPSGSSPHTYELTTGQMKFLAGAELLVTVGLELTPWAEEVFESVDNPRLHAVTVGEILPPEVLVPASQALSLDAGGHENGEEGGEGGRDDSADKGQGEEEGEGGEDRGHDHGVYDPHVWLDPTLCEFVVLALGEEFSRADPANASYYRERAKESVEGLRALDEEIGAILADLPSRRFVSFHSSLTYFARRYGLEQVGVIEELPGKEPSAGEIADLVEMVRVMGVRAVFAESQFSPRAAEAIAEASGGGVVVEVIDPLEDPGDPASGSYAGMMLELARRVAAALGG